MSQTALPATGLLELRIALAAGAAAGPALADVVLRTAADGPLADYARRLRLGAPLEDGGGAPTTGDHTADLLIRALVVCERVGIGAVQAVERALEAARQTADLTRLLQVRTAQARATARLLTVLPVALWMLLIALDGDALRFYRTPAGVVTGTVAVLLATAGHWWSRRIVTAAQQAAARPPTSDRHVDWRRGAAAGIPAGVAGAILAGIVLGLPAGLATAWFAGRARAASTGDPVPPADLAEAAELLAVALGGGLAPAAACAVTADLVPAGLREPAERATRRLQAGWAADAAFADGAMQTIGAVLATGERWGSPMAPALQHLATDLRAEQRTVAEAAGERAQITLVFPTTLLTLPAFVLAAVPPLLWAAFAE